MQMRADRFERYGSLGDRALRFTEGGYCMLFSEGMKLAGGNELDRIIAASCARIFDDEFEHRLGGIADIISAHSGLDDAGWQTLTQLTTEQLRQRVRMRNAQFSHPVGPERLQQILYGACEPIPFDYERALSHANRSNDHRPA